MLIRFSSVLLRGAGCGALRTMLARCMLPARALQLKLLLEANQTDMQLAFLGTAAFKPHRGRALASLALLRGKDVWIFDAGELKINGFF